MEVLTRKCGPHARVRPRAERIPALAGTRGGGWTQTPGGGDAHAPTVSASARGGAAPDAQPAEHVWGPAEFTGLPPWPAGEGLFAGTLGAGVIVGTAVVGAWNGMPALADGEAGLVCAAALALYLLVIRAGRAQIGIVAVLGVCLALQAPQVAAGVVLTERGRVESVVATSVEVGPATSSGQGRFLCLAADRDGVPFTVRLWRGCGQTTRPGDALSMVYDPKGRVPLRGVQAEASSRDRCATWTAGPSPSSARAWSGSSARTGCPAPPLPQCPLGGTAAPQADHSADELGVGEAVLMFRPGRGVSATMGTPG